MMLHYTPRGAPYMVILFFVFLSPPLMTVRACVLVKCDATISVRGTS